MDQCKTCASCRTEKPHAEFSASRQRKDGLQPYCKACRQAKRLAKLGRELRKSPPAYRDERGKTCPRCMTHKSWSDYYACRTAGDGHGVYCKACASGISRERWRERAPELKALDRAKRVSAPLPVPDPNVSKRCRTCRVKKPQTEFSPRRGRGDGFEPRCKVCRSGAHARWLAENPGYWRRQKLQRKYGITVELYDTILERQGGGCAICGTDSPGRSGAEFFSVDHDHATGAVRGLLCSMCNTGLGMFVDEQSRLLAAVQYLARPPAREVLNN